MKEEQPLLLLSDKLFDIQKGKGNRDGLIQQIVTYVRDGHTVTRKQWVRSEFADHAKKDEEEKKDVMLREQERKQQERKKNIAAEQEKQENADKKAYKKVKHRQDDEEGHHGRQKHKNEAFDKYKKKMEAKKVKDDKKDDKKDSKKDDKKDDKGKKKRGAYDQQNETKADNKRQLNIM